MSRTTRDFEIYLCFWKLNNTRQGLRPNLRVCLNAPMTKEVWKCMQPEAPLNNVLLHAKLPLWNVIFTFSNFKNIYIYCWPRLSEVKYWFSSTKKVVTFGWLSCWCFKHISLNLFLFSVIAIHYLFYNFFATKSTKICSYLVSDYRFDINVIRTFEFSAKCTLFCGMFKIFWSFSRFDVFYEFWYLCLIVVILNNQINFKPSLSRSLFIQQK